MSSGHLLTTALNTSNKTAITQVQSASARVLAGRWCLLASVITTLYHVAMIIFQSSVVSHGFSAIYVYSKFGIILIPWATFVPNFVSFTTHIAELARGEKLYTLSLNHSPSLFHALMLCSSTALLNLNLFFHRNSDNDHNCWSFYDTTLIITKC